MGPHAQTYVNQCGFIVRDRIPVSAREWKQKISAPNVSFVSDRDKNLAWRDITQHFTLQADDALKELVRDWTMKKMATLFQSWKKTLYKKFILKNATPNFNAKVFVKLESHWDAFVEYKTSQDSEERVMRNRQNARQKQYHHRMGSGGYRSAIPKWQNLEAEITAKGIIPETIEKNWPQRAKNWFYAHGGSLDPDTGKLIFGQKIERATQRLARAREEADSGVFKPNREKDELTYALENPEHGGRTRGYGAVPWLHAFPADKDTYRSRQRKKDEEAERIRALEQFVDESRQALLESREREKSLEARMQEEIKRQVQLAMSQMQSQSTPGVTISPVGQMKSSCASTELPVIQDDAGLRFPVDDITEPLTTCELHILDGNNASIMVAVGVVSPIDRTKTPRIHGSVIQPGYASVSVDRVLKGYSNVPLDIEGGDGEKTLGETEKTFIQWRKRFIIIPGAPPLPLPHPRYE